MASVVERGRKAVAYLSGPAIRDRFDQGQGPFNVVRRVKGDLVVGPAPALPLVAFLLERRVLFLDSGGVPENDRKEVGCGRRRHDRPGEALLDEPRDKSAMVEVGVR